MVVIVALVVVTVTVVVVLVLERQESLTTVAVAVVEVHVELGDTSCWFGWSCVGCVGVGYHSSVRCVEDESKACLGARSGSHEWQLFDLRFGYGVSCVLCGTKSDRAQTIHNMSEFIMGRRSKAQFFSPALNNLLW